MPRRPFVGGNWKSNGTVESNKKLIDVLRASSVTYQKKRDSAGGDKKEVDVVICPIAPHLTQIASLCRWTPIQVGGQNISATGEGAFTGEITAAQLKDAHINWTLVGHSERRTKYGEDDATTALKVEKAQEAKLSVIFCIGELLEEREKGETDAVNKRQLDAVIPKITDWRKIVIAYEPVWAIGTGKVATPEQAQEAHEAIRKMLPEKEADQVRIIYGGSVTHENCKELISKPDIDGFLVGGASLKPTFNDIITACLPVIPKTKPVFRKVESIEPEQRGVNLYVRVVSAPEKVNDDLHEVKVGDETGTVTLRVRGDRVNDCVEGKTLRVQNATVNMFKGFVRLEVDKWAALKPEEAEVGEINTTKDISAVEYELTMA